MTLTQLPAYALTIGIEALVAARFGPSFQAGRGRAALAAAGGSLITHPVVWWGADALFPRLGLATIPALEIFAILAESIGYRLIAVKRWRAALLLSGLANGISYAIGAIIMAA